MQAWNALEIYKRSDTESQGGIKDNIKTAKSYTQKRQHIADQQNNCGNLPIFKVSRQRSPNKEQEKKCV